MWHVVDSLRNCFDHLHQLVELLSRYTVLVHRSRLCPVSRLMSMWLMMRMRLMFAIFVSRMHLYFVMRFVLIQFVLIVNVCILILLFFLLVFVLVLNCSWLLCWSFGLSGIVGLCKMYWRVMPFFHCSLELLLLELLTFDYEFIFGVVLLGKWCSWFWCS